MGGSTKMIDGHIHIERGNYTLEWIEQFINKAVAMDLSEIWLLEHCYRFKEFVPMYDSVRKYSEYIEKWFDRKSGVLELQDYLSLIEKVRKQGYPVKIKFGLEICYFENYEGFIKEQTENKGFDFLLGSTHFIGDFAFDHKSEFWNGINVDEAYRKYFERSISLAKSGLFSGIAHPDAIKLFGHKPSFDITEYYVELAKALAENKMYAEQNSGVIRRCPDTAISGMNKKMLQIMKDNQVSIITVSDAHCPEDVGYKIKEMDIDMLSTN